MKLLAILFTLTVAVSGNDFWDPIRDECEKSHLKARANIDRFCSINNMVLSSAAVGPAVHCRQQFFTMHARHQKMRFFGKHLCQIWRIHYGVGATKPGTSDKWPFKEIMVLTRKRADDAEGDDAYGLVEVEEEETAPVAA